VRRILLVLVGAEIGTYDKNLADSQARLKTYIAFAGAALVRAVPES
jgi:hypothetical protein